MHVIRFVLVFWLTAVAVAGAANLLVLPWCWLRDQRQHREDRARRSGRQAPAMAVRQPARSSA